MIRRISPGVQAQEQNHPSNCVCSLIDGNKDGVKSDVNWVLLKYIKQVFCTVRWSLSVVTFLWEKIKF